MSLLYRRVGKATEAHECWSADGPFGTTVYVDRHGSQWSWRVWLGRCFIETTLAPDLAQAKVEAEQALADELRRAGDRVRPAS